MLQHNGDQIWDISIKCSMAPHLQYNPLLWQISQTLNGFRVSHNWFTNDQIYYPTTEQITMPMHSCQNQIFSGRNIFIMVIHAERESFGWTNENRGTKYINLPEQDKMWNKVLLLTVSLPYLNSLWWNCRGVMCKT